MILVARNTQPLWHAANALHTRINKLLPLAVNGHTDHAVHFETQNEVASDSSGETIRLRTLHRNVGDSCYAAPATPKSIGIVSAVTMRQGL